ncbi:MAG: hypothetical protein CBD74_07900 [Saprospirales bacterium TMED214]|nr:MAG: hypothetical protein CBD74_07900 [Saprospirales bacterium TMED214]
MRGASQVAKGPFARQPKLQALRQLGLRSLRLTATTDRSISKKGAFGIQPPGARSEGLASPKPKAQRGSVMKILKYVIPGKTGKQSKCKHMNGVYLNRPPAGTVASWTHAG